MHTTLFGLGELDPKLALHANSIGSQEEEILVAMVKYVRVGPWGGLSGEEWTYVPKGDISSISITYDEVIHSITFHSKDVLNGEDNARRFGTFFGDNAPDGEKINKIDRIVFNDDVGKLTRISGTVDDNYNSNHTGISLLSFSTIKNKHYGPYGSSAKGKAFSLQVDKDHFYGFHGRHETFIDAIGVILRFQTSDEVSELWGGGEGGSLWDYRLNKGLISRIKISHDKIVRSIEFLSGHNDDRSPENKFGSSDGEKVSEIVIDEDEKIIGIRGTFKKYDALSLVTSLSLQTTKKFYGRFGELMGKPFSSSERDQPITRFYGYSNTLINAIGVYRERTRPIHVEKWGGPFGFPWTYKPDGAISYISITYDHDAIRSISFASQDENGNVDYSIDLGFHSFGCVEKKEINIDVEKEKLNGISGTVRSTANSIGIITLLCFSTDKDKSHGPFGVEIGDTFSLKVKDGIISGFHGFTWLNAVTAIGVYLKPK